jgi:hypothetical protein
MFSTGLRRESSVRGCCLVRSPLNGWHRQFRNIGYRLVFDKVNIIYMRLARPTSISRRLRPESRQTPAQLRTCFRQRCSKSGPAVRGLSRTASPVDVGVRGMPGREPVSLRRSIGSRRRHGLNDKMARMLPDVHDPFSSAGTINGKSGSSSGMSHTPYTRYPSLS